MNIIYEWTSTFLAQSVVKMLIYKLYIDWQWKLKFDFIILKLTKATKIIF